MRIIATAALVFVAACGGKVVFVAQDGTTSGAGGASSTAGTTTSVGVTTTSTDATTAETTGDATSSSTGVMMGCAGFPMPPSPLSGCAVIAGQEGCNEGYCAAQYPFEWTTNCVGSTCTCIAEIDGKPANSCTCEIPGGASCGNGVKSCCPFVP